MIKVIDIAISCHAVTDSARARAFYEGVLGLKQTFQSGRQHVVHSQKETIVSLNP